MIALVAAAAYSVWAEVAGIGPGVRPAVGFRAPPFSAVDAATGAAVRLSDLRGKPVLLNFWATWCQPCRAEMPELEAARRDWEGRAHVIALGADESETPQQMLRFARELGIGIAMLYDGTGAAARAYQVRGLPTTFFIDRRGVIRLIVPGAMTREIIEEGLRAAGAH